MRLHVLEATAFGPFADTVRVDFDELGADGLFLLHGRTGAGKTSILDAVAFALYGTVPGARADGRRLLSDHAREGAVPQVTLEATIAGRRLRIVRSPDYERAKLRGTGTVKQNAKATLTWLDGSGQNLSRIPDIGVVVGELLGMSAEQFFQVVLLPQGEFAQFLRADSKERGKLLERLFDTTRFGDVEKWFRERAATGARKLAEQQKKVDVLSAKVDASAGIEAGADADPVGWARKLRADAVDTRDSTVVALDAAREADRSARAALEDAVALARRLERRAAAHAELAKLDAAADTRAVLTAERAAALRAAPVAISGEESRRAAATAEAALRTAADAAAALVGDDDGCVLLDALPDRPEDGDRDRIRPHEQRWSAEIVRLDDLIAQQRRVATLDDERSRLDERRRALAADTERLTAQRETLPARRAEAAAAVRGAEQAAASLPGLAAARDRTADAVAAATELASRRVELEQREQRVVELRSAHLDARSALLDIRERRIAGMAAELAAELADGQACAVCGSTDHPAPARPAPDTVTKADEDAARESEQRADTALADATAAVAESANIVAALRQRCGDRPVGELTAEHEAAASAHDTAAAEAAELDRRRAQVDTLERLDTDLQERLRTTQTEAAEVAQADAVAAAEAHEIRARIHAAVGDGGSLADRRARVAALASAATELLDRRVAAARARTFADERARDAAQAAIDAGFDDLDTALAAVRPDARLAEIDTVVRAADETRAVAAATLAEPGIAALTGDETADVAARQDAAAVAAAELHAALGAASEADRRLADIDKYTMRLEQEDAKLAPLRAEQDELARLADVIAGGGQNSRKMSLRSYVLAARLEEVAEAASARLRRMSGGRYEFVHSDAAGSHGKRGGLGLDIHDEYTGVVRSTKTLSGGESFQASLALALGLADVVAAESGGLVLDTMFIDEGFGTLDADALDSVMGVLDELRAGGRVVGVVSHVDEMRQRIPSRLHVVRGRAGSTVEIAS
ncbi:AAA family ATPase [Rhodococcus phenolicus]|uniref:AAA family ATPase n=1 Tax=Rhodococcus phenolicus TaxID=263849 RepID=UPI000835B1D5|nr:SMC family ATPase [Rhodococcus phenolicus]